MLNYTGIIRKVAVGVLGPALLWACTQVTEDPYRYRVTSKASQEPAPSGNVVPVPPPPVDTGDAILAIHTPAPASCINCHENKRPTEPVHYPGKDCVTCHAYPSFKGGFFAHAPKPAVCEECHVRPITVGVRAYPNIGTPANFNPNDPTQPGTGHYRGKDCVSCHATPAENATQFTFAHAKQSPEACLPCHFRDGVGEHQGDNRGVELTGFGNCFNCHRNFDQTVRRDWRRN